MSPPKWTRELMRQTLFVFTEGEKYEVDDLTKHERITIELLYRSMVGYKHIAVVEPDIVSLSSTSSAKRLATLQGWSHDALHYPGNTVRSHGCDRCDMEMILGTSYRICAGR